MGVGAAILGASALGAGASIFGGLLGSNAQKSASKKAIKAQQAALDKILGIQQPFVNAGYYGTANLINSLPTLTKPFGMTQADLEKTPGYQFALKQGLQGVDNAMSAKGWALSGPQLKGIADYTTGLANQTYGDQFNRYWAQNQNRYNMLLPIAQLGANVATNQGTQIGNTAANIANTQIGLGNAQAGFYTGAGNAVGGGINNAFNNLLAASYLKGNGANVGSLFT